MTICNQALLGSAAALLLLAGCGGSKTQEAPANDTSATAEAPPAAPEAAPEPVAAQAFADFTGDAAAGKTVFIQCQACHSLKPGENRVGPSLHGVIGATAGHVVDFRYSDANKGSGIVWTEDKLFDYLKNPRAMVPGTTMAFAGIQDPQKRANLIAYLKANGGAG
ncbi:cytochrome c family protein [Sandaracinobacter neustonicus]|uniref:Cytochrome c family protein n=1 Tax=Sandaracinobacter neustonicus TaxID=1715348 RepID=A0A501XT76_9SPHN|nr:cytochrome c family protein [Sandaracinobacter neustonicus]TPE63736.1 cytochrome c family protein [Sandaracinobacter neustonicus]